MGQPSFDIKRRQKSAGVPPGRKALPGREVHRRQPKKVSLWRHLIGSVSLMIALTVLVFSYIEVFGDAGDAVPEQRVELAEPPQPAAFDSLNGSGSTLPDLLGDVALGDNPTDTIAQQQQLDALGNPIGGQEEEKMAGEDLSAPSTSSAPSIGGITINGRAIGGGLVKAPVAGLARTSPYGSIPARASDGRTAFKVYARPYTAASNAKPVTLVIGGLGINRTLTARAINELPPEVSLSFAAHASNLQSQINLARARGHEVLLELPMESEDFNPVEPGAEYTLRVVGGSTADNERNIDRLLSRASGYFAVTNYNGGLFLQRSDSVVPMMASLSKAGLGFVFDGSVAAPSLSTLANASRLPYLKASSLIDNTPDSASINSELERLASAASSGAAPVGFGFTYPQTIDAVAKWVTELEAQGLTLAPVSSRILNP